MAETSSRPVWLLDVDGVLNACTSKPDRSVWPADEWIHTRARSNGHSWPILAARPVLAFLREVHAAGRVEIRWHTTWQHDAAGLAAALDLPDWPVQDAPEFHEWARLDDWWKLPAAQRVVDVERRPLLWTDDDVALELRPSVVCALGEHAPALVVSPPANTGLTPANLRSIRGFLDDLAA